MDVGIHCVGNLLLGVASSGGNIPPESERNLECNRDSVGHTYAQVGRIVCCSSSGGYYARLGNVGVELSDQRVFRFG